MERVQRRVMTKSRSPENAVFEGRLNLLVFLLKNGWLSRGVTGF